MIPHVRFLYKYSVKFLQIRYVCGIIPSSHHLENHLKDISNIFSNKKVVWYYEAH